MWHKEDTLFPGVFCQHPPLFLHHVPLNCLQLLPGGGKGSPQLSLQCRNLSLLTDHQLVQLSQLVGVVDHTHRLHPIGGERGGGRNEMLFGQWPSVLPAYFTIPERKKSNFCLLTNKNFKFQQKFFAHPQFFVGVHNISY